jgi:hypothetical protein
VYLIQHYVIKFNKACQWLAAGRWFSPGTPISSTNKTDLHDITEILLKVALNTINQIKPNPTCNCISVLHCSLCLKCISMFTIKLLKIYVCFFFYPNNWINTKSGRKIRRTIVDHRHIENPRRLVWHSVRQFRKTVWLKENLSDRIKNLKCHHIFRIAIKNLFICLICLLQE